MCGTRHEPTPAGGAGGRRPPRPGRARPGGGTRNCCAASPARTDRGRARERRRDRLTVRPAAAGGAHRRRPAGGPPALGPGRLASTTARRAPPARRTARGDLELRTSLELGYADLDLPERRALRRLALLDLPDFASWIAAPLLDIGTLEAEEAVERLVDCHFVEVIGVDDTGRNRYRIHDLAREHARERCLSEESAEERETAVLRLVTSWLGLARTAAAQGPGAAGRYFPSPPPYGPSTRRPGRAPRARPRAGSPPNSLSARGGGVLRGQRDGSRRPRPGRDADREFGRAVQPVRRLVPVARRCHGRRTPQRGRRGRGLAARGAGATPF